MTPDPSPPGLPPEGDEQMLTTAQIARIVQHHPDTITRRWVRCQGCPYVMKAPNGYRFHWSAVKAWLLAKDPTRRTPNHSAPDQTVAEMSAKDPTPSTTGHAKPDETVAEMSAKVKTAFARLETRRRQGRKS